MIYIFYFSMIIIFTLKHKCYYFDHVVVDPWTAVGAELLRSTASYET